jgi:hypothetical protein
MDALIYPYFYPRPSPFIPGKKNRRMLRRKMSLGCDNILGFYQPGMDGDEKDKKGASRRSS